MLKGTRDEIDHVVLARPALEQLRLAIGIVRDV